jgi:hypothetical protein
MRENIRVLNISAVKSDFGWEWNYWNTVAEISVEQFESFKSDRQTIKFVRNELGLLSEHSKGRVKVIDDDGYNLLIVDKANNMPLFCIEYGKVLY